MSRVIAIRRGQPRAVIMAGLRGVPGSGEGPGAGVSSFNGRAGVVSLTGADVTTALAYTPANAASLAAVALSGSYSDLLAKPFIPGAPGDIGAATAAQGALADTAVQPGTLSVQLDLKVDKAPGYGLSQENFTAAEKSRLAGIAAGATANPDTDSLAEGVTRFYFTTARVLATVLSGLSYATGIAITSSDSVLVAFGKLQKQITDLVATVSGKQDTLISAINIKTINGESVLGSGNIAISGSGADWGDIGGTLADQTDLQAALDAKAMIAGLPSRTVTASGAVTPADAGRWIVCNSTAPITLRIGAEATAAWAASGILPMFHVMQIGAGGVTVAGDGFSLMLHAQDTAVLNGPGAAVSVLRMGADAWRPFGDLVPV